MFFADVTEVSVPMATGEVEIGTKITVRINEVDLDPVTKAKTPRSRVTKRRWPCAAFAHSAAGLVVCSHEQGA
jgi:hypothetical protein